VTGLLARVALRLKKRASSMQARAVRVIMAVSSSR